MQEPVTYGEACRLLGFIALPLLERSSRRRVVELVAETTENGIKPVDPVLASVYRDQIIEFY